MGRVATATRSGKRQAWPPTGRFERLLKEACPNHVYPIKHKLRDYDMIKNFMISGSLTQGMELDEVPGRSDSMPFPREDVVITVYDGCPPLGRCHVSNLSTRTPNCYDWGHEDTGMCVCEYVYYSCSRKQKQEKKMARRIAQGHRDGGWPKLSPTDYRRRLAPLVGAPE
jgi:hypothetical protein